MRLMKALDSNPSQTIDNFRIQRLMGILPLTGKATMESIPSKADRSAFSCVRYQFFLDAPFEIAPTCCNVMKKSPGRLYKRQTGRVPMTAQMASESRLRTQIWLKQGCNAFDAKKPTSNPMAFWTEQDVLLYIYQTGLPIASVYGQVVKDQGQDGQMDLADYFGTELFDLERPTLKTTGCKRTGCAFCLFGYHLESRPNRLDVMPEVSRPELRDYMLRGGAFDTDGLWKPDGRGLGFWFPMQWCNVHGGMHMYIPDYDHYEQTYGNELTREYLKA